MERLLNDEQRLLQESVAKLLAQAGGLKRTRALRGKGDGFDPAVHARMGAQGWFGLLVPEGKGGLGLGLTELALVQMEAGRALAPEPIGATAAVASVLADGEASEAASQLLARVVAGDAVVLPAIDGSEQAQQPAAGLRARGGAREIRLDGVCDGVACASECEGFLAGVNTGASALLAYVPRDTKGLVIDSRATVDGRPFARLTFDGVAAHRVVVGPHRGAAAQRQLYDLLLFTAAAELVGVMSAALDMTVEYLKTRKQFGKPIGSFQALQHRAVDDFAKIVSARSFLFQVASQGSLSSAMASALKAHCGGMALEVTKSAIQMHGAIGFTDEHDIGLYLKRAMWLSVWLGNEAQHRTRYAAF